MSKYEMVIYWSEADGAFVVEFLSWLVAWRTVQTIKRR